jgi:hypothetical protein
MMKVLKAKRNLQTAEVAGSNPAEPIVLFAIGCRSALLLFILAAHFYGSRIWWLKRLINE